MEEDHLQAVDNGTFVRNTRTKENVIDPFHLINWELGASCDKQEPWLSIGSISQFSATYQRQHGTFVSPYPSVDVEDDLVLDEELRKKLTVRTQVKEGENFVTVALPPERWDSNTSSVELIDQKQYVFHLLKFRNENAKIEEREVKAYSLFLQFQDKLKSEHEVFQKVARETAEKFKLMYETLHPGIAQYVAEAWKHRIQRASDYPPYYVKQDLIPLRIEDEERQIKAVCHGILLEFGRLANPLYPSMNRDVEDRKVTRQYADIVGYQAPDNFLSQGVGAGNVYKTSVSKDVHAQDLAITHEPEFVVSMSALKVIGDNCAPGWEKQWKVPIQVKCHKVKKGDKMVAVKVVYLDKPLPKVEMNSVQKNKWFYKFSAKRKLFPIMSKSYRGEDYVVPVPPGAIGTAPKDHKRYTAWELAGPKGPIKMLLRSSLDGKGRDKDVLTEFVVSAKPEYQPWAGSEVMTPSEVNREWVASHFRPRVVTYRARIDVYTGEITTYEKLDEHRLLSHARRLGVFPAGEAVQPLVGIYSVLSSLKGLKEGNYLLHHEAKMGPFVKLSASTPEKTPDAIDISEIYSSLVPSATTRLTTVPWLPLDVETVTFAQKILGRIPATFEPQKGAWKNSRFIEATKFTEDFKKKKKAKKKKTKK